MLTLIWCLDNWAANSLPMTCNWMDVEYISFPPSLSAMIEHRYMPWCSRLTCCRVGESRRLPALSKLVCVSGISLVHCSSVSLPATVCWVAGAFIDRSAMQEKREGVWLAEIYNNSSWPAANKLCAALISDQLLKEFVAVKFYILHPCNGLNYHSIITS